MHIPARIFKILAVWFVVNTSIALVVFSFQVRDTNYPLPNLFLITLLTTHIISCLCALTGYSLGSVLKFKSVFIEMPITLTGTLIAALIGIQINRFVTSYILGFSVFEKGSHYIIPSLLIAVVVTIITVLFERLKFKKDELEKNLDEIKLTKDSNSENNSLSIREDEIYHVIRCDDLIYLSSHGKKTTLHTREKDYETNQLIKNIENKLSTDFIRIHKQFIINKKYLSQIKYYEGGRYMAYLNDDDESTLPVGRKIAPLLKEKLGI